jgi:hypothetical protein
MDHRFLLSYYDQRWLQWAETIDSKYIEDQDVT